jgi:hypothetical protein
VPDHPRWEFAGARVLYKLTVVRQMAAGGEPLAEDQALAFLDRFLPVVEETIAGGNR